MVRPLIPVEQEIRARLDEHRYREAFELLMPEYQNKVFRMLKVLVGVRGRSSISTWIYSIARNACLRAMQLHAAHSVAIEEIKLRPAGRPSDHGVDWQFLLSQLPEKYRQVLVLFYMEDKSYDEVARLLDLPMGTVKTYLHRARKDLAAAVVESKMAKGGR